MSTLALDKQEVVISPAVIGNDGLTQLCLCDMVVSENIIPNTPCIIIDRRLLIAVCRYRLPCAWAYCSAYALVIGIAPIMIFLCQIFKQLFMFGKHQPFAIAQPFVLYRCDVCKLCDVFVHRSIIA